jgi:hypothetical protein
VDFPHLICVLRFSSVVVESWGRGCIGFPSAGVEALDAGTSG